MNEAKSDSNIVSPKTTSLLDNIYDAVVILDADGSISRLNSRALHLLGYTMQELAGKRADFLFQHKELNAGNLKEWLDSYSKREVSPAERAHSIDAHLKSASDEMIPVDMKIARIPDCADTREGYLVSATDMRISLHLMAEVLERELALRKLSASEKKFSKLFIFNPVGILIIDNATERITDANPSAEEIFNTTTENLRGKTLAETGLVLQDMDFDEFSERLALEDGISETDGSIPGDSVPGLEGRRKKVRVSAISFEFEETSLTIVSISDITENESMRNSLLKKEKLESIWSMAGSLVHDFNNVIGIILGYAGILKLNTQNEGELETVSQIEQACIRGRELSQKLMQFSNGAPPEIQRCDALQIVQKTAGLLFKGGHIRVNLTAPEGLWKIRADKSQMTQVIENLLSNAEESMRGRGEIDIALSNVDAYNAAGKAELQTVPAQLAAFDGKTRTYVKITVRDHGFGIPKGSEERLFDPFFTTKPGGHGLGLAGVEAIMRGHRGAVMAKNARDGDGAVFTVFVPALPKTGSLLKAAESSNSY